MHVYTSRLNTNRITSGSALRVTAQQALIAPGLINPAVCEAPAKMDFLVEGLGFEH